VTPDRASWGRWRLPIGTRCHHSGAVFKKSRNARSGPGTSRRPG
jgi:hypothetical protein